MEFTPKTLRLLSAAKKYNIGKDTLVEFLTSHGFEIHGTNPNTHLSEAICKALENEFGFKHHSKLTSLKDTGGCHDSFRGSGSLSLGTVVLRVEDIDIKEIRKYEKSALEIFHEILFNGMADPTLRSGIDAYQEYLHAEFKKLKEDYSLKALYRLLKYRANTYIKRSQKTTLNFSRNLRLSFRTIIQFRFKNMDDNSGDDHVYQFLPDKHILTLFHPYETRLYQFTKKIRRAYCLQ